ncbi:hypothetical protein FIV42_13660 [Persicimonas caeni]|uniref:Disintegrin domain-containing protein n=1 Tax=Persicimonas caeni TaxID=2292766 RepID=A0A4Y6PTU3_PERCE|nr:hypothetical protein [Persicimonas caeni]QDG51756.1 hypothetical protein FIV42_13660 [Persicimonas caeni]QED32977.1 hypothetical protein FRD00_13655 [Persicimonas caeni]
MRKWTTLVIFVLVALVAACGTDDPGQSRSNGQGVDVGTDTTGGDDAGTDTSDTAQDTGDDGGTNPDECGSDADCTDPQICVADRSGNTVEFTCQDPSGSGQVGDSCSADSDCASNLCVDGTCSAPCETTSDCSDDGSIICDSTDVQTDGGATETVNICVPKPASQCSSDADCTSPERCIAIKGATEVTFECGTPNSGGGDVGDTCSTDADCAQNLCQDGTCSAPCAANGDCAAGDDFSCEISPVDLGNGSTDNASVCTPPRTCSSKRDCPTGQVCYVDRATGEAQCANGNSGGGGLGEICTDDGGCESNLCNEGRFRDVCTVPCENDSDCPTPGYECGTTSLDDGSGGTNDVSVCVAKDPTACTSNDDCASGLTCAIVPDASGNALESVCIPNAGGNATGVPCTSDSECGSLVCLNDHCSAPCDTSNQCGNGQLCQSANVAKSGLVGTFEVCETLPDDRCDQDGICSDGVRMCNDIRAGTSDPQAREAYCGMPDANASGALGDTCEQTSDCRSRICLNGNSDECSVICAADSQCAQGQACTTFNVGTSQLGFCNTACADNSDCGGLDFTDSNGNTVEHVCTTNENTREDAVDQICVRRNIVDPNDSNVGLLGDTCSSGSDCQSGLCLTNTIYDGTPCSSASDCQSGQVCQVEPQSGQRQCGDQASYCTRVCDDGGDCSGGVSGNALTACDSNIRVTLSTGTVDTISACSPN